MKRRNKIALAILALFVGFIAYQIFLVPHCSHDYMECDRHMMEIYSALYKYSKDHDGKYPAKLEELHPKYIDLTKAKCTMYRGERNSLETGYYYISGLSRDSDERSPILFCKNYHLNGHGIGMYCAQFSILVNSYSIIHVTDDDLRKYDGRMRRYPYFRKFPYDGSKPTLELVRSLEESFPDEILGRVWMNVDKKNTTEKKED